jgi:signal transduction histidine kinase/CheY-like chemotaxis protein
MLRMLEASLWLEATLVFASFALGIYACQLKTRLARVGLQPQRILDAIPDPVLIKNAQTKSLQFNRAYLNTFGTRELPASEDQNQKEYETELTTESGRPLPAQIINIPMELEGHPPLVMSLVRDITELKIAEREMVLNRVNLQQMVDEKTQILQKEAQTIRLLQNITSIANQTRSFREALQAILTLICYYMRWPVGHVYTYDPIMGDLRSAGIWHLENEIRFAPFRQETETLRLASGEDIPGKVLAIKKSIWVKDLLEEPQFLRHRFVDSGIIRSAVAFPVMDRKQICAVLEFFGRDVTHCDEDMLKLFENIALQLSMVIERERTEKELVKAVEVAREASQHKTDFLANMSHELRTPLNSIIGMAQLLQDTPLAADQKEMLETMEFSSHNLLEIVNDILDLSKIESGNLTLEYVPFNPEHCVSRVVTMLMPSASRKGLTLIYLEDDHACPNVMGDPTRFSRIVTNLVGNAIKYTENGTVEVFLTTELGLYNTLKLKLDVKDTGIGISAEKIDRIFEKFVQADASTTRKYGGSGLGLTITKQLVEMMDGSISAQSKPGKGSCFSVTLPFECTEQKTESDMLKQTEHTKGTLLPAEVRVLVAEDHLLNQTYIRRLLPSLGITHFCIVETGIAARDAALKEDVDLVLMDCHMPGLSGYDATRAIRTTEQQTGRHVPIIAMTANAMMGEREKCLECGMDEYISKPITKKELLRILSYWIDFSGVQAPAEIRSDAGPLTLDLTNLRSFSDGDAALEKEFISVFLDQSQEHLTLLHQHCISGTSKTWHEAAHSLKGGAATLGAMRMRELCAEAQDMLTATQKSRQEILASIQEEFLRVCHELKQAQLID